MSLQGGRDRTSHPLPSRLGGRAGGALSCSDLSCTTHAEPRRVVGYSDGGVPGITAAPGGHILLCPTGISAQHSHGRSCTSASVVEWGGEPPKKLKKKKR